MLGNQTTGSKMCQFMLSCSYTSMERDKHHIGTHDFNQNPMKAGYAQENCRNPPAGGNMGHLVREGGQLENDGGMK